MAYTAELRGLWRTWLGCVEVERWEGLPKSQLPLITAMFLDPPLELTAVFHHANSISIVAVEIFMAFVAG